MPSNDVSISLPSSYQKNDSLQTETKTTVTKPKVSNTRVEPTEIPDSINKVRKKVIKGVVIHGGI